MSELKQCPFCKSKDIKVYDETYDNSYIQSCEATCDNCGASGPFVECDCKDIECEEAARLKAAELWNSRCIDTSLPDNLEHCTLDEICRYVRNLQSEIANVKEEGDK